MSWEVTLMSNWTAAGGTPVAGLGDALPGSSCRRELGARGSATLVLDAAIAWERARRRAILRVDRRHASGYFEVRVAKRSRQTRGVDGTRFTVIGHPRVYDLGDKDLVRETIAGRTITRFNENLTPTEYFQRFFFANQEADGLQGLVLGTVESDEKIPLAWDRWTRGQLQDAVLQATSLELQWRLLVDGTEAVDLLRFVGDAAPTLPMRYGDLLLDHQLEEDYSALYTIARAAGEQATADSERAIIGENLWRVASRIELGAGAIQLELRAINSAESPIVEDGQYVAHPEIGIPARYLQRLNGAPALPILASNAAQSTVVVSGDAALADEYVSIVADASGTPLEVLELPSAVEAYGAVVADVQITGARGERQYARNGGHEEGIARWSAVNAGVAAEYARDEFGITVSGLSDGARSAGVGTGTPLALKGLPPGEAVRHGDAIKIGGATCVVQADAVPDATGALSLSISPGLPGAYADSTPFVLERREVRAMQTHDAASNPLCEFVLLDEVNNLNLGRFGLSGLSVTGGGFTFPLTTYQWEHNGKLYGHWRRAGRVVMTMPLDADTGVPTTSWATKDDDLYTVQPLSFAFVTGSRIRKPTESQWTAEGYAQAKMTFSPADIALLSVGTMVRWRARSSTPAHRVYPALDARGDHASPLAGTYQWWCAVVTAISGVEVTFAAHQPFGSESVMLAIPEYATPGDAGSGLAPITASDVVIATNTAFTWLHTKETRPLLLDGSHSLGATTVAFKPIANIATKNYAAGDTFTFTRVERWRIKTTAATEVRITDGLGEFLRYEITFTLDTGDSTISSIEGGYPISGPFYQVDPMVPQTLSIVSATSTTIVVHSPYDAPGFFDVEQDLWVSRSFTDTFTVSSVASAWSAAGTCTLNVTPTVPAGRSYGVGWRNIAITAPSGASTDSDLIVLASALVATDTQIQLAASDTANIGTAAPNSSGSYALYRVTANTGSRLPVQGNTLFAAATAIVAGDGTASVTVTAANTNAIANNEVAEIVRPALIPVGVPLTGSALRLFSAVGGSGVPLTSSAGFAHELAFVRVPASSARTITLRSLFTLSAGEWFAGQGPVIAIVDAAGTILGSSSLGDDGLDVEVAPGVVELTAQATVGASGWYGLRVYGGTADYSRWCVHVRSMLYLGEAADAPYSNESFASQLMLAVLRRLPQESQPRITDQLTALEVHTAHAQALGIPAALVPRSTIGGRVHLEDWDRVVRITALTETPTANVATIEVGQLARDGWRLLGETALRAGNRRAR